MIGCIPYTLLNQRYQIHLITKEIRLYGNAFNPIILLPWLTLFVYFPMAHLFDG
jgi:hypothetical protein